MNELEIGQKIYLEPLRNAARYNKDIKVCTVSKVGRKYFKVNEMGDLRFSLKTLKHDGGNYMSQYNGYLSMQDIDDKKEKVLINARLEKIFRYNNNISLSVLREIELLVIRHADQK